MTDFEPMCAFIVAVIEQSMTDYLKDWNGAPNPCIKGALKSRLIVRPRDH